MPRGGRSSRPLCRVARILARHGQITAFPQGQAGVARSPSLRGWRALRGAWRAMRHDAGGKEVALDQQHQHHRQAETFEHRQSEDQIRFQSESLRNDLREHENGDPVPVAGPLLARCKVSRSVSWLARWADADHDHGRVVLIEVASGIDGSQQGVGDGVGSLRAVWLHNAQNLRMA